MLGCLFRRRQSLLLENLALRQQLVMLKRRHPRPSLGLLDKLFWVIARRVWSDWKQALLVVTPETVVRWHRAGFRMYWRLISRVRRRVGRKQTPKERWCGLILSLIAGLLSPAGNADSSDVLAQQSRQQPYCFPSGFCRQHLPRRVLLGWMK
jgi:hypothetical protein